MTRAEPRLRLRRFVLGMMAGLPRTNCWSLAEPAGEACLRGMQRLLVSASWDADAVLGDVRDWVVAHLGAPGAILVIDETGDVKKGTATVGVQRQHTGTAGRIEKRAGRGLPQLRLGEGARPDGPGAPVYRTCPGSLDSLAFLSCPAQT